MIMSRKGRQDDLNRSFQKLSIGDRRGHASKTFKISPPTLSVANPNLLSINYAGPRVVSYQNVHPSSGKYEQIANLITNERFVIENIVEIHNPFLHKTYDLKKAQKEREYEEGWELLLFHGTKKQNLDSICTYNFYWRRYGDNSGHKFGKGVSFSCNAMYASNYSDPESYHKVMIVAKVLIGNVCQGHPDMTVPPPGFDTSQKGDNGIVVVKYEDNEFYPAYKMYYHIDE